MPPIRCLPNGDPVVLLQRFVDSGVDVVRREKDGWQRVVSVPRPVLVLSWEMAENGDVVVLSRSADSSELHLSRSDSQRWDEEVLLKIEAAETLLGAFVITVSWLIVPEIADGFGRVGVVFKRMRQRRLDRPKRRAPVASAKVESVVPQRVEHAGSKNDMQSPPPVDLQKQAEELQRRKDARLKCLFEWEAAASALENRFPRERLVEYFNTYMSTQHSVEVVEARAAQLLALLKSILRSCSAPQTMHFESLKELLAHFDRVREEIAATHADELIVQTLEAVAETGRIKAIEEYLKR